MCASSLAMSVPLCLARPTEPPHTHTCIGRSAPSAVLLSGARRAGPCARPSGRKQATRCLDPRECPAHPRCSERNSESNIEEMTEEEVRGAGLEAGASGMAHLAKSTARRGIVFVQRATSSAPPVFEQRQLSGLNLLRPRSSPASVASKNHRASPGGIRDRITESGGAL